MPTLKQTLSYLILGQKGGENRIRIIELLKERPYNINQIAEALDVHYRTVQHHIDVLTKYELVNTSQSGEYGAVYFLTPELEENMSVLEDVIRKLTNITTSPRFFQNVIEQTNEAVAIIDNSGETLFWNESAVNLFGYTEEEVLGNTLSIFPDVGFLERSVKKVLEGEKIVAFETKGQHKSGEEIEICVTMDGIEDDEGKIAGYSILIRDITERIRAQEELARHRDHLEELVKERAAELIKTNERLKQEIAERRRAEEKVKHLNLVLRSIRNINQLIVKEQDRTRLLQGACDTLVENRGYYNVWIAMLGGKGELKEAAEAGLGDAFLPMLEMLKQGDLTQCGERALEQPGIITIQDPLSTCTDCPLVNAYFDRGAMTTGLRHRERVFGLLSASIPKDFVTDEEEQSLFQEIADDIALALHNMES